MNRKVIPLGALVVAMLTLSACRPATQASPGAVGAEPAPDERAVADFYSGKTVRVVVGFAAGGGYDTYSRIIARRLADYIPGNPTVIVENMAGAGSIVAANYVYNAAPKDGTVIGNISGAIALEQLFKTPGVEFDMARFRYVGVPAPQTYVMVVPKRSGITSFEELLGPSGKQLVVGGIPGQTVGHAPLLLRETLGANFKIVLGYEGTATIRLALASGEVDGYFSSWESVKITNRAEVDTGEWLILAQLTAKPLKDLPATVPTIPDLAKTDEQRQLLLFGTAYPNDFGKVYVVAPEVPTAHAAALEAAFMKVMADEEFLADAQKARLEIDPFNGQQTRKLVIEMLGMSEEIRAKLEKIMKSI